MRSALVNSKKANNAIKAKLVVHNVFLPKSFDSKRLSRNKFIKIELENYMQKGRRGLIKNEKSSPVK